jgi:hypothetical protein
VNFLHHPPSRLALQLRQDLWGELQAALQERDRLATLLKTSKPEAMPVSRPSARSLVLRQSASDPFSMVAPLKRCARLGVSDVPPRVQLASEEVEKSAPELLLRHMEDQRKAMEDLRCTLTAMPAAGRWHQVVCRHRQQLQEARAERDRALDAAANAAAKFSTPGEPETPFR